jgi:hypothetical protein
MKHVNVLCTEICEMCYVPDSYPKMCYAPKSDLRMCHALDPKVYCATKLMDLKLVSAHNYFIHIMFVIKWSSSLSLWSQDPIA